MIIFGYIINSDASRVKSRRIKSTELFFLVEEIVYTKIVRSEF